MSPKTFIAIGAVILTLGLMVFLPRKSVHAELVIAAEPARIWEVLVDPGSYPTWNPIFVSVEGEFHQGSTLAVVMRSPDGSATDVAPKIRKIVVNQELNQVGGLPGILTFDHTWLLEPVDGGTKITQHEEYRGIGVLFWDPSWVEDAYRTGNQALSDYLNANR